VAEGGPGLDAASLIATFLTAESSPGTDAASLIVSRTVQEVFPGSDAASLNYVIIGAETAPGTDALSFISTTFSVGQTGLGVDEVSVVTDTETLITVTESPPPVPSVFINTTLAVAEINAFSDAALVQANFSASETGAGLDAVSVAVLVVLPSPLTRTSFIGSDNRSSVIDSDSRTGNVNADSRISLVE
jgi:hypothetical protein